MDSASLYGTDCMTVTHVQRFGGHPVGVDADQRKSSNSHLAQDGAADAGSAQ